MYYVYIIRSKSSGRFYTGFTNNFDRRIEEHNGSYSSTKTTEKLHDYVPIYVEIINTRAEARRLEKYFKSGAGREFRSEIVKYY